MRHLERLFMQSINPNEKKKILRRVKNNQFRILISGSRFSSKSLDKILVSIKTIKESYGKYKIPIKIIFDFGTIEFQDKVTFIILDMIIYSIFRDTMFEVEINMTTTQSIVHYGIASTAMVRSYNEKGFLDKDTFIEKFLTDYHEIGKYRKIVKKENMSGSNISKYITEIGFTLSHFIDDEEWIDDICDVISELMCNVDSHTDGDLLIDIDISEVQDRETKKDNICAVNIVVLNLSDNLIYGKLKDNICKKKYPCSVELYSKVYFAYENHKKFFSESYTEDDFFLITAFQNHVTTRTLEESCAGTGLSNSVEKIIDKSLQTYSYVLSGINILYFDVGTLVSAGGFIGFNVESDYLETKPDEKVLYKSSMYFPGTVFNLHLFKEVNNGK